MLRMVGCAINNDWCETYPTYFEKSFSPDLQAVWVYSNSPLHSQSGVRSVNTG